ncbi:MAG: hypothetical protein AAF487_15225 [Bacteroidota bacterium]
MKLSIGFCFVAISFTITGQTPAFEKYNLNIIDTCLTQIDSSIKVLNFRFINGEDSAFEKYFIEAFQKLDHIDYFLYKQSKDNGALFDNIKGMSISIYYNSISCYIENGSFTRDKRTGELFYSMTEADQTYCWDFERHQKIKECK